MVEDMSIVDNNKGYPIIGGPLAYSLQGIKFLSRVLFWMFLGAKRNASETCQ